MVAEPTSSDYVFLLVRSLVHAGSKVLRSTSVDGPNCLSWGHRLLAIKAKPVLDFKRAVAVDLYLGRQLTDPG